MARSISDDCLFSFVLSIFFFVFVGWHASAEKKALEKWASVVQKQTERAQAEGKDAAALAYAKLVCHFFFVSHAVVFVMILFCFVFFIPSTSPKRLQSVKIDTQSARLSAASATCNSVATFLNSLCITSLFSLSKLVFLIAAKMELIKANEANEKLKLLCREMQNRHNTLKSEVERLSEEDRMQRSAIADKFQASFEDMSKKLEEQIGERIKQAQENETFVLCLISFRPFLFA